VERWNGGTVVRWYGGTQKAQRRNGGTQSESRSTVADS
jgi:hypothetical protein